MNGKGSSDIYLNGKKKEIHSFVYLARSLSAEKDIGEVITHNCRKARTGIVRLRPALKSGSIMRLVEIFIKQSVLYGLESAVIRKVNFDKLNAVLNKTRRVILLMDSKRTSTNVQITERVQLKSIETEMALRKGKPVETKKLLAQRSKTYSKDWALNLDLERQGMLDKKKELKTTKK